MNANERDLVQRFVDDMTDYAIVILDVQGRVLTWNAGARTLFGYTSDDIVGRRFTYCIPRRQIARQARDLRWATPCSAGRHELDGTDAAQGRNPPAGRLVLRPLSDTWQRHVGFGLFAMIPRAASSRWPWQANPRCR